MAKDTPNRPGSRLAERFRHAIDAKREEERLEREAEQRRREAANQARRELLEDLAAFGRAVGHFEVNARKDRLTFSYDGRTLSFEPQGDEDRVKVSGDDLKGNNLLFIQAPLNKWVWAHAPPRGAERRIVLFDQGLEALIATVMQIHPQNEDEEAAPGADTRRSL
jgi:hypothetical protein